MLNLFLKKTTKNKTNKTKQNQMLLTLVLRDNLKNNYNVPYIGELNKQWRLLQQKRHFKI